MSTTRRRAMAAALAAAWSAGLKAEPEGLRRLAPSESATRDPEFLAFVEMIRRISARRDHRMLLALMAPVFRVDFDFGKGPAAFSKRWRPRDPQSDLWRVLDRMLDMPAKRYDETLYVVPYVYGGFPIDLDPLGHVVGIRERVVIQEAADAASREVGVYDHPIIPTAEKLSVPVRLDREEWIKVAPAEGQTGYVRCADVCSPAEYRAFFEKQKGKWRWLSLVCAD